ncbi:MAG: hypothetical protein ACFFD4_23025, partial [Candidatus Odinarchaeota archaeon]
AVQLTPRNDYWNIGFEDFFLGIVPYEQELGDGEGKMILRLRGAGKEGNKLKFNLQSTFVVRKITIPFENKMVRLYLSAAHTAATTFFVDFLTDRLKENIGLTASDMRESEENE